MRSSLFSVDAARAFEIVIIHHVCLYGVTLSRFDCICDTVLEQTMTAPSRRRSQCVAAWKQNRREVARRLARGRCCLAVERVSE